jgi:hypothetical protein
MEERDKDAGGGGSHSSILFNLPQDPLVDWAGAARAKEQQEAGAGAGADDGTEKETWEPLRKVCVGVWVAGVWGYGGGLNFIE